MQKKIIILIIVAVLVVAVVVTRIYFIKHNESLIKASQNATQQNQKDNFLNSSANTSTNQTPVESQGGTVNGAGTSSPVNTGQPQNKIITNDFSIDLPMGWNQTEPVMGASAMAVNAGENIDDQAAKKINFKSYFAVSHDTLKGNNVSDYSQTIKTGLLQAFPDAVFSNEKDMTINGNSAHAMEVEFVQQGVSFKILMVAIAGQGENAWVISFNTAKSSWAGYKEMFYNVANSFIIKQ